MDDVALPGFESYGDVPWLPLPGGVVLHASERYRIRSARSCADCIDLILEQVYGFRGNAPAYPLPAVSRVPPQSKAARSRPICRAHERARTALAPTTEET